ncbi:MAG: hypothetical protein GY769_20290 [bacterium]|nr:hypothetical protein [bacterium]
MIRRYAPHVIYTVFLGSLIYFYATVLGGCGPSTLQLHAQAAEAVRTLNNEAVDLMESEIDCEGDALAIANEDPPANADDDTRRARADTVIEKCRAIETTQHAIAAAHTLWVSALLTAISTERFDTQVLLSLAADAVRFYIELIPLGAHFDLTLPEVPQLISGFLGGSP